jgi:hypothetical protein
MFNIFSFLSACRTENTGHLNIQALLRSRFYHREEANNGILATALFDFPMGYVFLA